MKYTLWTIQHADAYKGLLNTGVLRADENYLFCGKDLKFAYDWMSKQLAQKIGKPPKDVRYPIWAWYQWEGKKRRRDLRCSGYAKRGTPMVQIEFEVEPKYVVLSDFDEWHLVLNNSYIADSEYEFDRFYERKHKNEKELVEKSWDAVFDLERNIANWTPPLNHKTIQATLWEIRMEDVKTVEHFYAK